MKREVEYAIQIRTKDGYEDYSVYSRRTCLWKTPIEDWAADIITGYEYKRCCERHRSTRLVKRVNYRRAEDAAACRSSCPDPRLAC